MNLVEEVYEPGKLRYSIEVVDKIPILHIRSDDDVNVNIPISGLDEKAFTGPSRWGAEKPIWSFDGGIIELQSDDRSPDGRYVEIHLTEENRIVRFIYLTRPEFRGLTNLLEREAKRQHRAELKAAKKQKGRNVTAFRQTMGNLRPENAPAGAWYYGSPNPVPEAFAAENGPGAKILEFLSGKRGTPKRQARGVKRQSVRVQPKPLTPAPNENNLPNLVPNRGGRLTRKTRRQN